MELAPRYCRSCGSRILVKNVCHNCNNDPLKGENYCYDCGALTPHADSCIKCGAKYKTNFPVKPMVTIASVVIGIIAIVGFFVLRPGTSSSTPPEENVTQTTPATDNAALEKSPDTIVNKPDIIINNPDTIINKPDTLVSIKPTPDTVIKKKPDSSKTVVPGIFASDEINGYNIKCTYFLKNQSQVMFFIAQGAGYIKVNKKIYALDRKRKGTDVAVFGDDEYEATIRIDGLSGSENEWLASCTLIIKDLVHNATARQKVYSACIEL